MNYMDGSIYHMVHFDNLRNIFLQRALLSKEMLSKIGIQPRSIAYESVQDLRARIFIWDFFERQYYSLHRYVPFYFAIGSTPMMHVQHKADIQNQLVILEVRRTILRKQGVLFTDGNATNQQLSQDKGEKVGIIPATAPNNPCRRIYRPGGPYGRGENTSNLFADVTFLKQLDWDGIFSRRYIQDWDEYKRIRSAEVLVPDSLSLREICGIFVNTMEMVKTVNALIAECGLKGLVPEAIYRPELFMATGKPF